MFKFFSIMLAIMAAVALSVPTFAADAAKTVEVHYLGQVQANVYDDWDGDADNKDNERWGKDFQVRRSRIILKGAVTEQISFFMETDDIKIGSTQHAENQGSAVFTQDAFINYKVSDAFQIACGQILLPFMHTNRTSGAQIFGVDYNTAAYGVSVIPIGKTTNNWRDTGVEFRGLVANGLVDYRVGLFNGCKPEGAEDDTLRLTGRVQFNFQDPETEFFYSENYLGKKNILSAGLGLDYQQEAIINGEGDPDDAMAWTVDFTYDSKIGSDMILTIHAAYVNATNNNGAEQEQSGYFVEAGLLMGKIQPLIKYASMTIEPEGGEEAEGTNLTLGCNYFIDGHNANLKAELIHALGDNEDATHAEQLNVQFQIFI